MLAILAAGGWAALVLLYAPVLSSGLRAPATAAIGLLVLLALAGVFLPALRPAIAVLAAAVAQLGPTEVLLPKVLGEGRKWRHGVAP